MVDMHEWEREWPGWPEFHVTELDPLGTGTAVCYECPRCGGLVRAPARGKHEAVCWGPEPLPSGDAGRDLLADYAQTLVRVIQSFPELGEHTVKGTVMSSAGARSIHTRFYGADFWITIVRIG